MYRAQILQVGMAVFLLGGLIYTIYWASIWDQTSDGLGGIYLAQFGAMAGVSGDADGDLLRRLAAVGRPGVPGAGTAAVVPGLLPRLAGVVPCDH